MKNEFEFDQTEVKKIIMGYICNKKSTTSNLLCFDVGIYHTLVSDICFGKQIKGKVYICLIKQGCRRVTITCNWMFKYSRIKCIYIFPRSNCNSITFSLLDVFLCMYIDGVRFCLYLDFVYSMYNFLIVQKKKIDLSRTIRELNFKDRLM